MASRLNVTFAMSGPGTPSQYWADTWSRLIAIVLSGRVSGHAPPAGMWLSMHVGTWRSRDDWIGSPESSYLIRLSWFQFQSANSLNESAHPGRAPRTSIDGRVSLPSHVLPIV